MTSGSNQYAQEAAQAVITRLFQMRQLWGEAAWAYFEPQKFRLALQNCIMTSQTVTFILQSNKAKFSDFDACYAPHQDRWKQDPIMRWARNPRCVISIPVWEDIWSDFFEVNPVQISIGV